MALNIGGIANITAISAGATPDRVIAFATGARRGLILGKITPQVVSIPQANLLLPRTGASAGCGRTEV